MTAPRLDWRKIWSDFETWLHYRDGNDWSAGPSWEAQKRKIRQLVEAQLGGGK